MIKRIGTVQDISCFGKCSLTVALPVISAMGIECAVIPSAVLSTHSGGFTGYTFRDLTEDIAPVMDHWKSVGVKLDAIYTGYLGSAEQISLMKDFIKMFRSENTVVFIDPVMGDRGKLYSGFDAGFASQMASLAAVADVISPNLTEAAYLLGEDYRETDDRNTLRDMLKRLTDGGTKSAVITGIVTDGGARQGAVSYDAESGEWREYFLENIEAGPLHGSGDVFSSVMAGALTLGFSLGDAMSLAADFTVECIRATVPVAAEHSYGVMFEKALYKLHDMIETLERRKNC